MLLDGTEVTFWVYTGQLPNVLIDVLSVQVNVLDVIVNLIFLLRCVSLNIRDAVASFNRHFTVITSQFLNYLHPFFIENILVQRDVTLKRLSRIVPGDRRCCVGRSVFLKLIPFLLGVFLIFRIHNIFYH